MTKFNLYNIFNLYHKIVKRKEINENNTNLLYEEEQVVEKNIDLLFYEQDCLKKKSIYETHLI